jgi:hypothetical protein
MRPQAYWGFAVGLTVGSLAIAAAAAFGSAEAQHLPACETPVYASLLQ